MKPKHETEQYIEYGDSNNVTTQNSLGIFFNKKLSC